ncbi:MAG: hypothetical protein U0031_19060 [Thermomicrobiales bacterium]
MNPSEHQQATDLDRFWDALGATGDPADPGPLNPETAAFVTRMMTWGTPPHSAAARNRVWQQLQPRLTEESDMTAPTLTPLPWSRVEAFSPNGSHARGAMLPTSPVSWRAIPGFLATAAVLVLALTIGLVASGSWPRLWQGADPSPLPAMLPAVATPATTTAAAETLFDLTIPPDQLPRGENISAVFDFATSPAGSTGRWLAANSEGQPGLRIHFVVDGDITMRAAAATQVVRAGSTVPEEIPAATEVTLSAGDTWMAHNEMEFAATNPSTTPSHILVWVLANVDSSGGYLNSPMPSAWIEGRYVLDQPVPGAPGIVVPDGAAQIRLQRIELKSKASVPPPALGRQYALAALTNADGSPIVGPSVASQPSGKIVNVGRKTAIAYVLTFAPAGSDPGTPLPALSKATSYGAAGEITGGSDPLQRPSGIAVGDDGTVYLVDADRDQVRVFTADGTPADAWGESGTSPGQFEFGSNSWADLAIGPNGHLFILDPNLGRIQEFTPDGTYVRGWGKLGSEQGEILYPNGIGIDRAGQMYVADYGNHRVQVFDAEGRFLAAWDGTKGGGEPLAGPADVAISDDGTVWVTDEVLHRIIGFHPDGTAFTSIGGIGDQPGEMRNPQGIAIDAAGNLAVAEYGGDRVQRFAPDGSSLEVVGASGSEPGQFQHPFFLAFGPDGALYVSDEGNHRVQVFAAPPVSTSP